MANLQTIANKWNPYGYHELIESTKAGFFEHFKKVDAPVLISTTAAWRAIMGKISWYLINYNNPAFGAIRKVPWVKSGERIVTAEPGTAACQGVSEQGTLPDAQKPTFAYHATQFKQVVTRFQMSRKMRRSAELGDDSLNFEDLRNWAIQHNALEINKMILEKAEPVSTTTAYAGKDGFEALDRIISCDGEEDDLGGAGANYFDPWTKYEAAAGGAVWDRDAGTTYDSVSYHADGTISTGNPNYAVDAPLSVSTIDKLIDSTQDAGADPRFQFFLTSRGTARKWAQLVSPKQRFDNYESVEFTVNGIQTVAGRKAGFKLAMYDDIPIVVDRNVPADGSGKIFLIDSRSLYFKVATPTFLMSPAEAESYQTLDKLSQDYWFLTEGELWCNNPKVQGKISAISA